ncbi:MAG: hypothetical protein KatS3mg130_0670 [Candidatus Sumerlaea sp.]|jgi:hypothetical protein|uniref:Uncharacterized protein n=1 Tax=Sumerlaea chitinivorans TaxID=2250252 RepID=A0A2Z4Y3J7_SUMC1|nr:hypothetical protein BRCON_1000 [Candidatus Sumerlaea chitinivorans]GIX44262.1 MAG: hypothetical protein KatS3mg130_0670 [Candidatus Sumerlaea sp.]
MPENCAAEPMISVSCYILSMCAGLILLGVELLHHKRLARTPKVNDSPWGGLVSNDSASIQTSIDTDSRASTVLRPQLRLLLLTVIVVAGIVGIIFELRSGPTSLSFHTQPKVSRICAEWLLQHLNDLPMRQEDFSANIRFLAAAKEMFEQNRTLFPLEARLRLENLLQIETQLRQLPSISEQGRIYRTAQDVFVILRDLAKSSAQAS